MYNPYSLENKTILVTGASSGIGRATAIECSKLGATVIITARNEDRLKKTLDSLDRSFDQEHKMVLADVTNEDGISALLSALPELDGMSSNAGMAIGNKPLKFIADNDLQNLMQTNTYSHLFLTKALLKEGFEKGASCVFTASIGGTVSHGPGIHSMGCLKQRWSLLLNMLPLSWLRGRFAAIASVLE